MPEAGDPANGSEPAGANSSVDINQETNNIVTAPATGAFDQEPTEEALPERPKPVQRDIVYKVECRDRWDELVKNFESHEPFEHLEVSPPPPRPQDQNEAISGIAQGPILEIVTSVKGTTLVYTYDNDHNANLPRTLEDFAISSKRSTTMIIKSQVLLKIVREIVSYYPTQELTGDTVTITEPYPVLVHHLDELSERLGQLKAEAVQKVNDPGDKVHEKSHHLQVLLDFLQPTIQKVVQPAIEKLSRPEPVVTFDTLWYLYRPGADLYIKTKPALGDRIVTGVMTDATLERLDDANKRDRKPGIYVRYFKLESNGVVLDRRVYKKHVDYFEGEREVTSLNVYPASFWDAKDGGERRRSIESHGEQIYRLLREGNRQMRFTGYTCSDRKVYYENTPVIVDVASALRYIDLEVDGDFKDSVLLPRLLAGPKHPYWDTFDNIVIRKVSDMTKHQYFLVRFLVYVFVLKDKRWRLVGFDDLSGMQPQEEVMRSLVLEDGNMEILQAVCQAHELSWKIEFIEDKGEGQIILLHGPPGVGKTYTVESFSEASGRPLITLTVADIGLEDETIENKLAKWFSLAETWKAILLLDEADIFMERRSRADIQRNALVSVFLRQMEYFKGIFFLTTNRIGHIDDAFLSRVNIVIGYDPLSDEKRARIWNGFFGKLQKDMERRKQEGLKPIIQVSKYAKQYVLYDEEIRALQWNGREIRNALQTAISLARYRASKDEGTASDDAVDVEVDHFKSVTRMSKSFRGYMDSISKLPEAERARRAWDRNDDFRHQRDD